MEEIISAYLMITSTKKEFRAGMRINEIADRVYLISSPLLFDELKSDLEREGSYDKLDVLLELAHPNGYSGLAQKDHLAWESSMKKANSLTVARFLQQIQNNQQDLT